MSTSTSTRRAVAEINFGEDQPVNFRIGNHSIHQFWHLFSSHFRHVLLAPQRRPDSGRVAWTWRESLEKRPVTTTELVEVRRRLSEANQSLEGGFSGMERDDNSGSGAAALEAQVRSSVTGMIDDLIAQRDSALIRFVCRTDAGLMIHSWGGTTAAEPYYPDAQNSEINGTLIAGTDRPAGVSVILENAQGFVVTRVRSEADGSFRFPNVAPGDYRVRVVDRSDFPTAGVAVTMERDPITGLELRGNAADSVPANATPLAAVEAGEIPWYKRRVTTVIVLLGIFGIGGCVWRSAHRTNQGTEGKSRPGSWQSASGEAAGADGKASAGDDRKVGAGGAWSTLTASRQAAKKQSEQVQNQTDGSATRDRSQPESANVSLTNGAPLDGKNSTAASGEKGSPVSPGKIPPKYSEKNKVAPASSGEGPTSKDDPAESANDGDLAKTAENKLAKSVAGSPGKKKTTVPGTSLASVDESSSPGNPGAGIEPLSEATASTSPTNGNKSGKAATGKNRSAPGAGATVVTGQHGAEAATQDSGASASGASSTDQLKASAGRRSKEAANGNTANGTAAPTPESADAVAVTDALSESSPTSKAVTDKAKPSSSPKKIPVSAAGSPQAKPSPEPVPEDPAESAAPPIAPLPGTKSTRPVSPTTDKAASEPVAEPQLPEAAPQENPEVVDGANNSAEKKSPTVRGITSSMKPFPAASTTPSTGNETPALSASVQTAGSGAVELSAANEGRALKQIGRIKTSPWKARLVQDLILPTRPMSEVEEDEVEAIREKMLREKTARMPALFRQPQIMNGFAFEISRSPDELNDQLRWRDDSGAVLTGATVESTRAELAWSGNTPPRSGNYILGYVNGREIARVTVDQTGVPTLKVLPGTHAWYWAGIESSPPTAPTSSGISSGLEWRSLSGAALPATWLRDDRWRGGRGQRIDIPLGSEGVREGNYGIALVDSASGWAMACDLSVVP